MSRLAGVYLSELSFGKFGHLKDGSPSCLAQSNPQEFVIYNQLRIESITWLSVATLKALEMWLSEVQETIISRNSTSLVLLGSEEGYLGKNPWALPQFFTYERDFYSFEFDFMSLCVLRLMIYHKLEMSHYYIQSLVLKNLEVYMYIYIY